VRSAAVPPRLAFVVAGALVVMALARFVPPAAQYVIGAAGIVALWPLAYAVWRLPATRPAGSIAAADVVRLVDPEEGARAL
jgi:hypothetical protein